MYIDQTPTYRHDDKTSALIRELWRDVKEKSNRERDLLFLDDDGDG